jgi:hypothetical protein
MLLDRLVSLMHRLTDQTVFAELFAPFERVLARVYGADGLGRTPCVATSVQTLSVSDNIVNGAPD